VSAPQLAQWQSAARFASVFESLCAPTDGKDPSVVNNPNSVFLYLLRPFMMICALVEPRWGEFDRSEIEGLGNDERLD
jgi:hypothetical protein